MYSDGLCFAINVKRMSAAKYYFIYLLDFQILIFYGPRSNAELLLHSGFVYDDNVHDRLAVRMGKCSFWSCIRCIFSVVVSTFIIYM